MSNSSDEQGSPVSKKPGASRPSLLGSSGSERDSGDDTVSILSAVKTDTKTRRASSPTRDGPAESGSRTAILIAGVLVVSTALYFVLRGGGSHSGQVPGPVASAPASLLGSETAPATTPAPAEISLPQTATIESSSESSPLVPDASSPAPTPVAEAVPISTPSSAERGSASRSEVAASELSKSAGSLVPVSPLTVPEPAVKADRKKLDATSAAKSAAKSAKAPPPVVARDKAKQSEDRLLAALNQSSAPGQESAQRDVDLIAALLEHTNPSAAGKAAQARVPKALPSGPKVALTSAAQRDVVERRPGESTAQLIRRCEEFGVLEGLLCRIRICSDLWGKDPACPAQSAPPSVRP
jgi:hypothetical protein